MIIYDVDVRHLVHKDKVELENMLKPESWTVFEEYDANMKLLSLSVSWDSKSDFLEFVRSYCGAFIQEKHVSIAPPTVMQN